MNLKNPSMSSALALVGVGLISLSGAIVFVASGRPALAAPDDNRRLRMPGVPITAERGMPSAFDGPPPMVGMGAADGCAEGDPLGWFGAFRELPECWVGWGELLVPVRRFDWTSGLGSEGMFDLNADGREEALVAVDWEFIADVSCVVSLVSFAGTADSPIRREHCVLPGGVLSQIAASVGLPLSHTWVRVHGWRDFDQDADLDLVIVLGMSDGEGGIGFERAFWLENTGFEATQPLVGDLDGDGAVGASDLTMLLGGWTGN